MNRLHGYASLACVLLIPATASLGQSVAPGQFNLTWTTGDCGGGKSASGSLSLEGTIAQPDAGPQMSGGAFTLLGGFWPGPGPVCIADVTGNMQVDIDDLLLVINSWGVCGGCPADVNEDNVVNIDDLLAVINAWGPCP